MWLTFAFTEIYRYFTPLKKYNDKRGKRVHSKVTQ